MSRRKAKKLDWVISAVASGVMALSPINIEAQDYGFSDPSLTCPLAENQCSEYLYEVYSRSPEFSGPTPGSSLDFPEATLAPIIPAISDDLAGHGALTFGCGDYDRVRVSQRVELDLPSKIREIDSRRALQQLAAMDLTTIDEIHAPSNIDFQGTCYEQSIQSRHRRASVYRLMQKPTVMGDLVSGVVTDAIHHANRLQEEYGPYDMVTRASRDGVTGVDYWQAYQHLNIEPVREIAVDYWHAHQHLNIDAVQTKMVDYWQAHQHLNIEPVREIAVDYWHAHQNLNIDAVQTQTVDYWQAHQHLNIEPAREIAVDYWHAHQNLNIDAVQTQTVDYWQAHQHLNIEPAIEIAVDYWHAHQHLNIDAVQTKTVDYWQAHQHLNIEPAREIAADYWEAHAELDIHPVVMQNAVNLGVLAAAPDLMQTYVYWILDHRYVKSPALLKHDIVQRIEMKLCGTPALETWMVMMHHESRVSPEKVLVPSHAIPTETILWFADLLDTTGMQFQRASSRLSQMARTAEKQRQIR
jgi:hypothetical protein